MRSLVDDWRGHWHRVVTFLDEGIGGSPDFAGCQELSPLCHSDLDFAGVFVSLQNCEWEPSEVVAWLCFYLDFSLNISSAPLSNVTKLQEGISRILGQRLINAKDLASIAGQLKSNVLATGNIVRLMTRSMYPQISAQRSWFSTFSLEHSVGEELVLLATPLGHLNGHHVWFNSSAVRVAY